MKEKGKVLEKENFVYNIYSGYLKDIYKTYMKGDATEGSYYPYLKTLIENYTEISKGFVGITIQPKKTEAGHPDFVIRSKHDRITGYIEAKPPETKNLDDVAETEQLKRYRESLSNVILTNFLEFQLYRNGKLIKETRLASPFTLITLKHAPSPEHIESFNELLEEFFSFSIPQTRTAKQLATELAKRTRLLENLILDELKKKTEEVIGFYETFREELISILTEERFADVYAQTITYGLFSARMRCKQEEFKRDTAYKYIPQTVPLLRHLFYSLTGANLPESLGWIVDDITDILANAKITSILKDFHTEKWSDDPVIHFYETFLAVYNPKERKQLGVYYTPAPVVSYIVHSIHQLLKEKFDKADGFADRTVTLLDPAAGTLTFPAMAVRLAKEELKEKGKTGIFPGIVKDHILPHFYAFEILVAPYAIGHFKIAIVLEDLGYTLKKDDRFQFYLTNTLEMKAPKQVRLLPDLAKEGEKAKQVKEKIPILVVLGNPPYTFKSTKTDFIKPLMEDYKEMVRGEKKFGVLEDDYIKFIRFAQWKVDQSGCGIVGFITNHSYLFGVIHRGMRYKLMESFDEIYILNLHGNAKMQEKCPDGSKDENVFAIMQGVAIALFVKTTNKTPLKPKVYYADLWGLRKKKYQWLSHNDYKTTKWQKLKPKKPYYFFVPKEFKVRYGKFWSMKDIFAEFGVGVITRRDKFAVDKTKNTLKNRVLMFKNLKLEDKFIEDGLGISDTYEWNLRSAREKVANENINEMIKPYNYRVWDCRWIYYSDAVISRTCRRVMKHLSFDNISLITTRFLSSFTFQHAFVSKIIGDTCFISNKGKESNYYFPLYIYSSPDDLFRNTESQSSKPNFKPEFFQTIRKIFPKVLPEEIFYYIYGVLYSDIYRKKYRESLRIDFPKIPLTNDYEIFKEMSNLGKELVEIHLLKSESLQKDLAKYPVAGSDRAEEVKYQEKDEKVYINKEQYFANIPGEIWQYHIGAYQVLEKWLKDRRERSLTSEEIEHYLKIATAIKLTIEVQRKIDEIYPSLEKNIVSKEVGKTEKTITGQTEMELKIKGEQTKLKF